ADRPVTRSVREKIALFTNVDFDAVVALQDLDTIYQVPLSLHESGLDDKICALLNIWSREPRLQHWERIVQTLRSPKQRVRIAMVGKYVDLVESYKSLNEALTHGGIAHDSAVDISYVDAEEILHRGADKLLSGFAGVLVPGGFGQRGSEGKIEAIRWARVNGVPFLGICLGMQMAVVEYARHVAELPDAASGEFEPDAAVKVIDLMDDQQDVQDKGGTMRLGAYPCELVPKTLAARVYGQARVSERHRHRYEFNNAYREPLEQAGLVLSGLSPDGSLVEMVELPSASHPFFIACQFHPEFTSRPTDPHPLFAAYIAAALDRMRQHA
ncbi:MAG: CTP synthase, partial [Nannocystaceae bacterium]